MPRKPAPQDRASGLARRREGRIIRRSGMKQKTGSAPAPLLGGGRPLCGGAEDKKGWVGHHGLLDLFLVRRALCALSYLGWCWAGCLAPPQRLCVRTFAKTYKRTFVKMCVCKFVWGLVFPVPCPVWCGRGGVGGARNRGFSGMRSCIGSK